MSLSEKRLADIAANLPPADADLSRRERDAHALLAEVERLRAGIESLADWHETKAEKAERYRPEINGENRVMDKAAQVHRDASARARDLRNPTEGGDR